jgi:TolA-binding protein
VNYYAELSSRSVLLAALLCGTGGCASLDRAMLDVDANDRGPAQVAAPFATEPEPAGPMDRFLMAAGLKKDESNPYVRPTVPVEARQAYDRARQMFERGDYAGSEQLAHDLAKEYRDTVLEEDALFLEAESQFARKRYAAAQDTYAELFDRFPSTQHMDTSTAHLFEIAQTWLRFPKVVKSAEIQPVNFDAPSTTPLPQAEPRGFDVTRAVPILPNFTDRSRPWFDTEGNALLALKSIWLNDPTGDLADDALMLTASHYLRKGDYMEADRYYAILREEYPKSPHLEEAFVLGSHVKLMSYQGAAYDSTSLEEAERLKKSTLSLFPTSAERDRIESELAKIEAAAADRQWEVVQLYMKKGRRFERSVALTCHTLLTEFPDSKYAAEARQIYNRLPAETKQHLPPLANEAVRTRPPNLAPTPDGPYEDAGATGRAQL